MGHGSMRTIQHRPDERLGVLIDGLLPGLGPEDAVELEQLAAAAARVVRR